jgi:hypothetical protein
MSCAQALDPLARDRIRRLAAPPGTLVAVGTVKVLLAAAVLPALSVTTTDSVLVPGVLVSRAAPLATVPTHEAPPEVTSAQV